MKTVISIDLGATNLRVGIISEEFKILSVLREPTTREDPLRLYAQIKRMLTEVLAQLPPEVDSPTAVGVSACGFCENDFILNLPNLHIQQFDLKHHIERDFPELSVKIANDANCAAYTEARYGAASEVKTSFFITVSSGIGGCLVYNHELIDLPFEIGHTIIRYQGRLYEVEKLLSGNGIVKLAKLNKLTVADAGELFEAKKRNEPRAVKTYEAWIQNLGLLLANIQIMYNTDMIVLSGGVMKSSAVFLSDLEAVTEAFLAPIPAKPLSFGLAKFDQDAGLIGGAGLALDKTN